MNIYNLCKLTFSPRLQLAPRCGRSAADTAYYRRSGQLITPDSAGYGRGWAVPVLRTYGLWRHVLLDTAQFTRTTVLFFYRRRATCIGYNMVYS